MANWQWRHNNDVVPRYGTIHVVISHVHKRTNRVRGNQTKQDLAGNDGPVILSEKTNQNLLQLGRFVGMGEETSMMAGSDLEIATYNIYVFFLLLKFFCKYTFN